ncbi:hypothetical protein [Bradyrhizobium sp. BR 10289]|uniref:hypothetical protein n=1 Tax=Bradyrhizobium sp. BR 10289 TaxID=2749993 RepID=UPI001C653095|nr:hypothetical protein [Bradyrhizobium sp. BR 10289]MBW7974506.1 hypothetical protein [Bradyrhizobium sp. BR 10289]
MLRFDRQPRGSGLDSRGKYSLDARFGDANISMPKHSAISLRVTDDVKAAAEKAAKARRVPVAAMINDLLIAHLKEKGYLREDAAIS